VRTSESHARIKRLGATLLVAALLPACYDAITPPHRAPTLILPDTGSADGASLLAVTVTIDTAGIPSNKRAIALTTTAGTFTAGGTNAATLAPDVSGAAVALLRAPSDSTTAVVAASVNGETVFRTVVFRRAFPDRVDVVPDQPSLRAGSGAELPLTIYLRRTVGIPSPGTRVELTSANVSSDSISTGRFLPAAMTSDATGVLRARFTAPDTTYRGPVRLRATVAQSGLSGDAVIQLTPP
jgi:hypothetical protein